MISSIFLGLIIPFQMKVPVFACFSFIPILLLLVSIHVVLVSGQCQSDQQSLLLQLKANLNFDGLVSSKLAGWSSGIDCCNWPGVVCDGDGLGHVVGLDLSNESISGGLDNSSLFSLPFLQSLNLAFNRFHYTRMPTMFLNLTSLVYLNLSNAGFVGQIPIQISQMTQLVTLDLSTSSLLGDLCLTLENPNLARLVQHLTRLRELRLDGVNTSAIGSQWSRALSSSLPNLQVLSLSNCFLSGGFDSSLANLALLSVIKLNNNNLSTSIIDFLADFSNLTLLFMNDCELHGVFPRKTFQIPTLEILDLSNNPLLQGTLPEFGKNLSLKRLVLKYTGFSGSLPDSIGNLEKLSWIDLVALNFTGPIPSSMENLTQLVYVDLSSNKFTGSIPSFRRSNNLNHVDFSRNQLSRKMSINHWEGLENLAYVDLRYNSLSGSIPPSLLGITSLEQLQLGSNQFRGLIPNFPNASSSLLNTIDLSGNKLEGPIPNSIFYLRRLNVLLLSSNNLNGTVQLDWLQKLGNLTKLDLSYNSLTVDGSGSNSTFFSFPKMSTLRLASCNLKVLPDIRNHSALIHLDLSDNQITGMVPPWIWDIGGGLALYLNLSHNLLSGSIGKNQSIPSLSILDLHNNNLQGDFPMPPETAIYVDYSSNSFSSSIQQDIGDHLNFAIFFSLSNNSLGGGIPPSICDAAYLQVLDLSNNNLNGKIPDCLIKNITSLRVLNLRGNAFTGSIPDKFPGGCALRTLDLSRNNLEGSIPASLGNCTILEVLDVGNNHINTTFPCILKSITSLRVLVLRRNNFHGPIMCHNNGSWPNLQIIDIAYNEFRGKLPGAILTRWNAMKLVGNVTHDHLKYSALWLSNLYYQDSVMVTVKGLDLEIVKILKVFTSIDISRNNFEGPIPETLGQLNALYILNLSCNALTGHIPPSLGNLSQLESLDLSVNDLNGAIPQTLAILTFLSFLNLSNNRLVGIIPRSTQLQSFLPSSFQGNPGLCGRPLNNGCTDARSSNPQSWNFEANGYKWEFIVPGIGFGIGAGAIVAPLLLRTETNKWYDDRVEKLLLMCLPLLGLTYYARNDWRIEADEEESNNGSESGGDEGDVRGRYCVFCTKLDITRRRTVHNPKCTCRISFLDSSPPPYYLSIPTSIHSC